jgi:hypothetical protein
MTTREGSRASRYGARDAGSFGTAVSSALPTVYLFRPCPTPAVGARGEPLESNEREMSERRHRAAFEQAHAPVAAAAPAAPRTGRRSSRRIGGRCDRDAPARRHRSIPSDRGESSGPARVCIQIGWSSRGQSSKCVWPASLSRSGVTLDSSAPGPIQPVGRTTRYFSMISVHSWTLFDDLRIVIADAAPRADRMAFEGLIWPFSLARRTPAHARAGGGWRRARRSVATSSGTLPWDGDLGHLERDIAAVAHHLRADVPTANPKQLTDARESVDSPIDERSLPNDLVRLDLGLFLGSIAWLPGCWTL